MTIDPAIVIAFIGALLGLLGTILKLAIDGKLTNPDKVVPRAMYEEQVRINASYPPAIIQMAENQKKMAVTQERIADNGKTS